MSLTRQSLPPVRFSGPGPTAIALEAGQPALHVASAAEWPGPQWKSTRWCGSDVFPHQETHLDWHVLGVSIYFQTHPNHIITVFHIESQCYRHLSFVIAIKFIKPGVVELALSSCLWLPFLDSDIAGTISVTRSSWKRFERDLWVPGVCPAWHVPWPNAAGGNENLLENSTLKGQIYSNMVKPMDFLILFSWKDTQWWSSSWHMVQHALVDDILADFLGVSGLNDPEGNMGPNVVISNR